MNGALVSAPPRRSADSSPSFRQRSDPFFLLLLLAWLSGAESGRRLDTHSADDWEEKQSAARPYFTPVNHSISPPGHIVQVSAILALYLLGIGPNFSVSEVTVTQHYGVETITRSIRGSVWCFRVSQWSCWRTGVICSVHGVLGSRIRLFCVNKYNCERLHRVPPRFKVLRFPSVHSWASAASPCPENPAPSWGRTSTAAWRTSTTTGSIS